MGDQKLWKAARLIIADYQDSLQGPTLLCYTRERPADLSIATGTQVKRGPRLADILDGKIARTTRTMAAIRWERRGGEDAERTPHVGEAGRRERRGRRTEGRD